MVLLTNFIPPYRIPVFQALQRRVKQFRVLISTRMEGDRDWDADAGGIDVVPQRSITWNRTLNHPSGFSEPNYIHFPYDTLTQLIRFRPDVVVSGEFGFRTLNAVLYRRLFRKSRLVVWATISEDTERYRSRLHLAIRSFIVRGVDAIMTNGASGIRYLEKFPIARHRLFAVGQTTDIRAFASVNAGREGAAAHRIIYSGRLIARKQLTTFVGILNEWCRQNPLRAVEMWFVGDGPERQKLEKMDLVPGLMLKFFGSVTYSELPAIYEQCGAMIVATFADEWGLVVNEALAAGVVVLGSVYSQAVQELVIDGENGWVFRAEDIEGMRRAVSRFLALDETSLAAMREKARASVAQLTPECVADKMLAVIEFARNVR